MGDQVWVCEAADVEKLFEISHQHGTFLLAYQLSLCSTKPLQESHVKTALEHLRRKCPNLRLCFGYRDEALWLRRSFNEHIDFEVVEGIKAEDVRDILQTYKYNSETGPLWCARLLLDSGDNEYNEDNDFPYTSHLFIGMHHSISDGITNLLICGCCVTLLNDVISGNPVNDEEIGQFISDTETDKIVASKIIEIQQNSALMQEMSSSVNEKGLGMPVFLSSYPPPERGQDKTSSLTHVLDATSTKKLIDKCKEEGVTLNSSFTALTLASIVSLMNESGNVSDTYKLCHGHVINLRRYWSGYASLALGCHAHFPLNLWSQVPKDVTENFWEFTRRLHGDIQHHLKEGTVLLRDAYVKINSKSGSTFDDIFNNPHSSQVDAGFSNLGDITPLLGEGGPHVKASLLIRQVSLHNTNVSNFAHLFHSYKGRLILNLLYNTKYISKELAQEYCQKIFDLMQMLV